jgi:hypothetical protein
VEQASQKTVREAMPALADVLGNEMAAKLVKQHPAFVLSIRASVIRAVLPALEELLGRWVCESHNAARMLLQP